MFLMQMGVFRQSIWFVGGSRLYAFIYGVIYAYICSMVKGRVFALNTDKFMRGPARSSMARGYGADVPPTGAIEPHTPAIGSILSPSRITPRLC